MKKILLFTFLWVLPASYSFAQYSDYKLNSYKTADYNRKLFELELNSSGNVSNSALKSYYEEKQKGHSLSGNFEGTYFQRTNTRKREQSIRLSSNLSGTHSNSKQEYIPGNYYGEPIVHESKRRNYNLGATLYTQNYFYNNNNTFFEISPYVNVQSSD